MADAGTETTVEVARPGSEIEALAMSAELADHGIDAHVVAHRGHRVVASELDRGWGRIRVARSEEARARAVLERWIAERDALSDADLERAALDADPEAAAREARRARALRVAAMGSPYRGGAGVSPSGPNAAARLRRVVFAAVGAAGVLSLFYAIVRALWGNR